MENSNAHRPVPATEDIIAGLPRELLEVGCMSCDDLFCNHVYLHGPCVAPVLEKDCAVCKEQFKLETDDPDEQIVVTLPCTHPFHEPCILPWLKSSGTCPVCRFVVYYPLTPLCSLYTNRHALVPQPDHHPPPNNVIPNASGSRDYRPHSSRPSSQDGSQQDGLFHSLFSGWGSRSGPSSRGPSSGHHRSNSDPSAASRSSNSRNNLPGSWNGDLD